MLIISSNKSNIYPINNLWFSISNNKSTFNYFFQYQTKIETK